MSKPKRKQPLMNHQVNMPDNLSIDQLKEIISDAIIQADNKRKAIEKKQNDSDTQQQRTDVLEHIQYKESPGRGNDSVLKEIGYSFKLLFTIITFPREKIRGDTVLIDTIRIMISAFFGVACYGSIIALIAAWAFEIYFLTRSLEYLGLLWYLVPAIFLVLPIAGLFRIMSIEIEKMQDRNTLLSIASMILVIITLIVTVASMNSGG